MTKFFLKLFTKNLNPENERSAIGQRSGIVGIVCNVFLFLAKLLAGLLSGSVSIMADAMNNLTDATSSVVTLLGFKMSEKQFSSLWSLGTISNKDIFRDLYS